MEQLSVWVGAGLVTAGVSAALLAGAGAATADSGATGESGAPSSSEPSRQEKPRLKPAADGSTAAKPHEYTAAKPHEYTAAKPDATAGSTTAAHTNTATDPTTDPTAGGTAADEPGPTDHHARDREKNRPTTPSESTSAEASTTPSTTKSTASAVEKTTAPVTKVSARQDLSTASPTTAAAPVAPPAPPTLLGVVQGVISAVVVNVGSLVFNTVQAVEAVVTGPPVPPPGSTVTVRTSTILLNNGQRVAANWYFPAGDTVPDHMILLQHGFLALGPMYSYTATNLAEQTHSIVVTPTLSSNPFAGDANWLGGTAMAATIGDLFDGDRQALTRSALDAGFGTIYGVDAVLPRKFALAGHSLGANLVSGAAGHLADTCLAAQCTAADLVGVILLDGVPVGATLPTALASLADKETLTGFVPMREIGAPLNLYNFTSTVNADLSLYRPDRYKGVVLDGGVHSDPMRGGNPLIQLALYVAAGFPQPQNPPAVDELSVQWLNEWFAGDTGAGDGTLAGTTIDVPTPQGTAHGVVIGPPPATKLLAGTLVIQPSTPSTIPPVHPTMATLAA